MAVGCSICCQNMASANKIFYGKNVWPWTTKKILTWRGVGEYVLACMLYIYIERPFVGNKKRVSTSQCRRQPSLGSITVKSLLWSCWRASTLPHTFLKPQTFLNKGGGSGQQENLIIWSPYPPILTWCDWILNRRINGHWDHVRLFTRFSTFQQTYRQSSEDFLEFFFSSSGKWVQIDLVTLLRGDLQSGMTSFK